MKIAYNQTIEVKVKSNLQKELEKAVRKFKKCPSATNWSVLEYFMFAYQQKKFNSTMTELEALQSAVKYMDERSSK